MLNIVESTVVTVNRDQVEDALVSSTPIVEGVTGWKVKLYLLEPEGTILFTLFNLLIYLSNFLIQVHGET